MSEPSKFMRAATIVKYNAPLEILTNVPIPVPAPAELLVKITATSLCMSDVMCYKGLIGNVSPPYCGGHEPVGVVHALGSGVTTFRVGDRVGFMPAFRVCKKCRECTAKHHRLCESPARLNVGFGPEYGGFSEYALADPLSTVKIPDGLSDDAAAPLLCAGVTAYSAVKKCIPADGAKPESINIIGCGGVGHLAVKYAKAMGFRVNAYDIAEDRLQLAKDCGADAVFNTLRLADDQYPALKAEATIVIADATAAYDTGMKLTHRHGRLIAVGVPHGALPVNMMTLIVGEISLIGTNQGTTEELEEAVKLAAEKGISPIYEVRNIDKISESYEDVMNGKVVGRIIFHF